MTIEKQLNGSWLIYAMVGTRLLQKAYYGYTKQEAINLFRQEVKRAKTEGKA